MQRTPLTDDGVDHEVTLLDTPSSIEGVHRWEWAYANSATHEHWVDHPVADCMPAFLMNDSALDNLVDQPMNEAKKVTVSLWERLRGWIKG